jgi:hypothetical protein
MEAGSSSLCSTTGTVSGTYTMSTPASLFVT